MPLTSFYTSSDTPDFEANRAMILKIIKTQPKYTISSQKQWAYYDSKEESSESVSAEIYGVVNWDDIGDHAITSIDYDQIQWWQYIIFSQANPTPDIVRPYDEYNVFMLYSATPAVQRDVLIPGSDSDGTPDYTKEWFITLNSDGTPHGEQNLPCVYFTQKLLDASLPMSEKDFLDRYWISSLIAAPDESTCYHIFNKKIPSLFGITFDNGKLRYELRPGSSTQVRNLETSVTCARGIYVSRQVIPAHSSNFLREANSAAKIVANRNSDQVTNLDQALLVFMEVDKEFPTAADQGNRSRIFVYAGGQSVHPELSQGNAAWKDDVPQSLMYEISYSEYDSNKLSVFHGTGEQDELISYDNLSSIDMGYRLLWIEGLNYTFAGLNHTVFLPGLNEQIQITGRNYFPNNNYPSGHGLPLASREQCEALLWYCQQAIPTAWKRPEWQIATGKKYLWSTHSEHIIYNCKYSLQKFRKAHVTMKNEMFVHSAIYNDTSAVPAGFLDPTFLAYAVNEGFATYFVNIYYLGAGQDGDIDPRTGFTSGSGAPYPPHVPCGHVLTEVGKTFEQSRLFLALGEGTSFVIPTIGGGGYRKQDYGFVEITHEKYQQYKYEPVSVF